MSLQWSNGQPAAYHAGPLSDDGAANIGFLRASDLAGQGAGGAPASGYSLPYGASPPSTSNSSACLTDSNILKLLSFSGATTLNTSPPNSGSVLDPTRHISSNASLQESEYAALLLNSAKLPFTTAPATTNTNTGNGTTSGSSNSSSPPPDAPPGYKTELQNAAALNKAADAARACIVTVSPATDVFQAAGLANYMLSRPGATHFILQLQDSNAMKAQDWMAGANPTMGNASSTAIRVAQCARRLASQDAVMAPWQQKAELVFCPMLGAHGGVNLIGLKATMSSVLNAAQGHLMQIQPDSIPIMDSLEITRAVVQLNTQVLVTFTAAAAAQALQALALAHVSLAATGQHLLIWPQQPLSEAVTVNPFTVFQVSAVLASSVMSHVQLMNLGMLVQKAGQDAANLAFTAQAPAALAGSLPAAAWTELHLGLQGVDALTAAAAAASMQPALDAGLAAPAFPAVTLTALAPTVVPSRQVRSHLQLPTVSEQLIPQQQAHPPTSGSSSGKPRTRKADYVIVTEETAIKNAAGAVAKVLCRISHQGICCPVFTEKRAESFTAVVSVAVKAIAVARGYVMNEGTSHEVAFQPYLKPSPERQVDVRALNRYILEKRVLMQMLSAGKDGHSAQITPQIRSLENCHADLDPEDPRLGDERSEMAFDVFKVPAMPETQTNSNLPVKVTAHSRASVVSSIIYKLVTERDTAVLITAGGRAMHVAMTAVVMARARLCRSHGVDILLMPRFVTVDTTSTLGWESVFLRFTILKAVPRPVSVEQLRMAANAEGMGEESRMQLEVSRGLTPASSTYIFTPAIATAVV